MKRIILVCGKITGISPVDGQTVNVRIETTTIATKVNGEWNGKSIKKDNLIIPYSGPVRLSKKELEEFALPPDVSQTDYGIGVATGNLFYGDNIGAYIQTDTTIDANENEHLIVEKVLISLSDQSPKYLHEFQKDAYR